MRKLVRNCLRSTALGVYIHIPFCLSKCFYCDFLSCADKKDFEGYTKALTEEIRAFDFSPYDIETVFIGGGTPTVLPPLFLQNILEALPTLAPDAEVTTEANPGTLDAEKLKVLRRSGVNRLSIGLQAWQDAILKKIGRVHNREQFVFNYATARKAGFDNVNVDLMFSLPNQTREDLSETLEQVCALAPEHISLYSLILEEGTKLFDEWQVNEEIDREMYHAAVKFLNEQGYERYEISNFARRGYICRHNMNYWRRGDYIGFGLGAHSFLNGRRFHNTEDYAEYMNNPAAAQKDAEEITEKEAVEEFMFLGLRTAAGVRTRDFEELFGKSIFAVYGKEIEKFKAGGFINAEDGRVCLTDKGIDVSNVILAEFLR